MLERPVLGGTQSQLILFTGVVAGTVGRWLVSLMEHGAFSYSGLGVGLIASIVTFPVIWNNAGLKELGGVNFVKWCVAFQNGYFWPALLEQVGKAVSRGGGP